MIGPVHSMDRVPPAKLDSEQVILGSIPLDETGAALASVRARLTADDFYRPAHQQVFGLLCSIVDEGKPITPLTLKQEILNRGLAGQISRDGSESGVAAYVHELLDWSWDSTNLEYHIGLVKDAAVRRTLIVAGVELVAEAYSQAEDVGELISAFQQKLYDAAKGRAGAGRGAIATFGEAAREAVDHARAVAAGDTPAGLLTGFDALDKVTGGFQPGDLVVLASDTGYGKTTFAGQFALTAAEKARHVYFVSREMLPKEIGKRLLQCRGEIEGDAFKHPWAWEPMDWHVMDGHVAALERYDAVVDSQSKTVAEIAAQARLLGTRWGKVDLLVVDYLQLCQGPGDTRAQRVGGVAWSLKTLAMEMGSVVLLLSQFDRAANRSGQAPTIHNLKESGDTENAANIVLLLWRPEKAGRNVETQVFDLWLRVAKSRDGRLTSWDGPGAIRLQWKRKITKFVGCETIQRPQSEGD
ncbi:MAG TPA: DnaB-like helicase C-terminal domain-containing protein [Phycisphaerae bacterium]|nr:DnaB-like helicase C-terminal domain-containing protein [Phycisphaerae bacterium]